MTQNCLNWLTGKRTGTLIHAEKKSKNVCGFTYPQPPMRSTQILYPLDDDTAKTVKKAKKNCGKTLKKINNLKEGKDITFDQLLKELDVSERDYVLAVRSSINCPTIILKRTPNELRINNYISACLHA